jgi:hypothetical protein
MVTTGLGESAAAGPEGLEAAQLRKFKMEADALQEKLDRLCKRHDRIVLFHQRWAEFDRLKWLRGQVAALQARLDDRRQARALAGGLPEGSGPSAPSSPPAW